MNCKSPHGFSFTEILFAVMILGIGFIMIAAMFPVAIQQTEATNSETVAAAEARTGASFLQQVALSTWTPPVPAVAPNIAFPAPLSLLCPTFSYPANSINSVYDIQPSVSQIANKLSNANTFGPLNMPYRDIPGQVWSMHDLRDGNKDGTSGTNHNLLLWTAVAGNMIQVADQRFAWVAFYKRDLIEQLSGSTTVFTWSPFAQVIVVAVQARTEPAYVATLPPVPPKNRPATDLYLQSAAQPAPLDPTLTKATLKLLANGITQLTFPAPQGLPAATGAYVIISDDTLALNTSGFPGGHGFLNGHVYQLGNPDASGAAGAWELSPGKGLTSSDGIPVGGTVNVFVYLVGQGPDPDNGQQFGGPAQDISVYSTFIQVNN